MVLRGSQDRLLVPVQPTDGEVCGPLASAYSPGDPHEHSVGVPQGGEDGEEGSRGPQLEDSVVCPHCFIAKLL